MTDTFDKEKFIADTIEEAGAVITGSGHTSSLVSIIVTIAVHVLEKYLTAKGL